jgi:peptide-methionine (R)-S-oxide reductase
MKKITRSDIEWKSILNPEQYRVCRRKSTEPPHSGDCAVPQEDTAYRCSCCGLELFRSGAMFRSGTGWPSFQEPVNTEALEYHQDNSLGMRRVEVTCARCGCHLGHVFEDGPTPTGRRYCINSVSITTDSDSGAGGSGEGEEREGDGDGTGR